MCKSTQHQHTAMHIIEPFLPDCVDAARPMPLHLLLERWREQRDQAVPTQSTTRSTSEHIYFVFDLTAGELLQ